MRKPGEAGNFSLENLLRNRLHENWNAYFLWRCKFLDKSSRKSVHRLRTSIRRFSSFLDLLSEAAPSKAARKLSKSIRRELKCLAEVRDSQVQLKRLREDGLENIKASKFRGFLKGKEHRGLHLAKKQFEKSDERKLKRYLGQLDRRLSVRVAGLSRKKREKLLCKLQHSLEESLNIAEHLRLNIRPGDHKTFHKMRLQIKDVDYKLESTRELLKFPPDLPKKLEALKKEFGSLQDQVALLESAKGYFRKSKEHRHPKRELKRDILRRENHLFREEFRLVPRVQ